GVITAHGAPVISITNNSPDYLVFTDITIPFRPGGTVVFSGAADASDATKAGITLNQSGSGGAATVTVSENYPHTVSNSPSGVAVGPAIYFNSDVNNLGGQVSISNVEGSVGFLATVNALAVTISAPNGVLVVSAPGVYYSGAQPFTEWDSQIL